MDFGPAQPELLPGARNAIETCLAIQPGERVALIADLPSKAVASSLAAALKERDANCEGFLLEDLAPRPLKRAPQQVLDALGRADAGILCMQPMTGELGARKDIVGVVERRHIRYAHMIGVTPEIMQQGMRADYNMVDRLSEKLLQRMHSARSLTVRTEAGTSLVATFDAALDWVKTSGLISRRYWSNLPAGEVFTTPAKVDGTFVCDGTAGDHFAESMATCSARRWCWKFRPAVCRKPLASARIWKRSFGVTATPTKIATASVSWPSVPTSAYRT
jgi:hypothetical protein